MQMKVVLEPIDSINSTSNLDTPKGYQGLAKFHKYWGKKPREYLAYLIESLTDTNDLILDPFLGSGIVGREAIIRHRKFIGIDINPIAIQLAKLITDTPDTSLFKDSLQKIEFQVKDKIEKTYQLDDGYIATHYLWEGDQIKSTWRIYPGKKGREEREPTLFDRQIFNQYQDYQPQYPRPLKLFDNSRINSTSNLSLNDLFTGRALHNIDLILDSIYQQPVAIRPALLLTLTSVSGQMSRMVFAITGRGKMQGKISDKIEVGSWVIGYWRPHLHFEINVWNCYYNKALKFLKTLESISDHTQLSLFPTDDNLLPKNSSVSLIQADAKKYLDLLPSDSISLIITDPPHGDRIPYLELSEMWNSLLGISANFSDEIIISNAKERNKTKSNYIKDLQIFMKNAVRVLKPDGFIVIIFNARDQSSWEFLDLKHLISSLSYIGSFPMNYSANSVVQDNRKGALKQDFILVFQKTETQNDVTSHYLLKLTKIPGWSSQFPTI